MVRLPFFTQIFGLFAIMLGLVVGGCAPSKSQSESPSESVVQGPPVLKLLVVDDPQLSAAIEQLAAEWKARTGTNLELSAASEAELSATDASRPSVDAVIYAPRMIGTLAERGWIVPLPADYETDRELAWRDTFELLQVAENTWSKQPYAIPFGSPVLTLYARADLLTAEHKEAPRTWEELHEQAVLFGQRESLGEHAPPADAVWHGALQPLAKGWAGRVLLARAATYVKHRDHFSTLFDIETMAPLIAGEGYVRALEELVADYQLGPPEQLEMDAKAVREAFLSGQAAFAISWPGHANDGATQKQSPTTFAELPGARDVFNFANNTWDKRQPSEGEQVPLLGLAGRVGSVTASTSHPQSAFQLLSWLAGREWGAKVASASAATTLYRRSQVRAPLAWVDPGTDSAAAASYAATVQTALSRQQYLFAPRIPGQLEYMAALDEVTRAVLRQEKTPAAALADAATEWDAITERYGRDSQKQAYRVSLGF